MPITPPATLLNRQVFLRVNWQAIQSVWPVLLLLGYLLVTAVLTVLTYERKKHIDLHDRVRESLQMRNAYFRQLSERMRNDR